MKNLSDVKSISIVAKQWFDKVNGNSYFSARIEVEMKNNEMLELVLPFQYGYGDQYRYEALEELRNHFDIKENTHLHILKSEHGFALFQIKMDKCLKREVKDWGIL